MRVEVGDVFVGHNGRTERMSGARFVDGDASDSNLALSSGLTAFPVATGITRGDQHRTHLITDAD